MRKEALQAAEEELRKRLQIIADIRALEASLVNVRRDRPVDFTETPGFGFLNEMSIAEVNALTLLGDFFQVLCRRNNANNSAHVFLYIHLL